MKFQGFNENMIVNLVGNQHETQKAHKNNANTPCKKTTVIINTRGLDYGALVRTWVPFCSYLCVSCK